MNLKHSTTTASFIVVGGRLILRAMDIIVLMVLARILTPSDFGIIAMAKTAILILEAVTELPIGSALFRQEKLTDAMFNTALTLAILRGLAITILIIIISLPLASFYGEPRVVILMIAMSFSPLFRGIYSPKSIIPMKEMDFQKQALWDCVGKLIALILSISYALIYKDYWALVIMIVLAPAITSIISFKVFPMRYRPSLSEWAIFKDVVGWNFLIQLFSAINWQFEKIILPGYISSTKFGFYSNYGDIVSMAYQTVIVPISGPISVSFQKAKIENKLRKTYNITLNVAFSVIAPIYGFIACFPEQTIFVFFGKNWLEYSYVLQCLSLITILHIPSTLIPPLANILYKNRAIAARVFIEFLVNWPITLFAVKYYGINGAIFARFVSCLVVVCVSVSMTKKFISAGFLDYFCQLIRPWCALLITHLTVSNLHFKLSSLSLDLIFNFVLLITLYLVIYFFSLMALWVMMGKRYGIERLIFNRLRPSFF